MICVCWRPLRLWKIAFYKKLIEKIGCVVEVFFSTKEFLIENFFFANRVNCLVVREIQLLNLNFFFETDKMSLKIGLHYPQLLLPLPHYTTLMASRDSCRCCCTQNNNNLFSLFIYTIMRAARGVFPIVFRRKKKLPQHRVQLMWRVGRGEA